MIFILTSQWCNDGCDQLLVDALLAHDIKALLDGDDDIFINMNVPHIASPRS